MNLTKFRSFWFKVLPNFLIVLGVIFLLFAYGPIAYDEVWYQLKVLKDQRLSLNDPSAQEDSVFARFLTTSPISIEPVNKKFSIVIEKLGVNAPIVMDVPVADRNAYFEALHDGVAHASVSEYPSDGPGNVYLFAHSAVNFWEFGKYAKVFNLLRKLEIGDRVHVFYDEQDYIYEVVNSEVLKGWNTYPLTRSVIEPTLTLQTCDPPGTTLNRLVITANLVEVK
jgi:LPXTG-site transpeptidase (sortase) family protein